MLKHGFKLSRPRRCKCKFIIPEPGKMTVPAKAYGKQVTAENGNRALIAQAAASYAARQGAYANSHHGINAVRPCDLSAPGHDGPAWRPRKTGCGKPVRQTALGKGIIV